MVETGKKLFLPPQFCRSKSLFIQTTFSRKLPTLLSTLSLWYSEWLTPTWCTWWHCNCLLSCDWSSRHRRSTHLLLHSSRSSLSHLSHLLSSRHSRHHSCTPSNNASITPRAVETNDYSCNWPVKTLASNKIVTIKFSIKATSLITYYKVNKMTWIC